MPLDQYEYLRRLEGAGRFANGVNQNGTAALYENRSPTQIMRLYELRDEVVEHWYSDKAQFPTLSSLTAIEAIDSQADEYRAAFAAWADGDGGIAPVVEATRLASGRWLIEGNRAAAMLIGARNAAGVSLIVVHDRERRIREFIAQQRQRFGAPE